MKKLITSESVTIGHPDKICDQISDAILDEILKSDPNARVACDVAVNTGLVLVMGEITTDCYVDIPSIVRRTIKDIGYTNDVYGFDADSCAVLTSLDAQSPDISQGVTSAQEFDGADIADKTGAGDQGMMFGYACDETDELMPLPIVLAHGLTAELARARLDKEITYLRPDGKSQVTVLYENGVPVSVDTVVLSTQHAADVNHDEIKKDMTALIKRVIPGKYLTRDTKYYVNPTGRFVVGGPSGDSGLTGRKIIVDTYGGFCPHGGGAFSGKDATKVDRSATYYARYIAKNIVAAGLAGRCEIEVAYAIGKSHPVSVYIDTFGTSKYSDEALTNAVNSVFDLRPYSIIKELRLNEPVFYQTAKNGHFGKKEFSWENTDKTEALANALKAQKAVRIPVRREHPQTR